MQDVSKTCEINACVKLLVLSCQLSHELDVTACSCNLKEFSSAM